MSTKKDKESCQIPRGAGHPLGDMAPKTGLAARLQQLFKSKKIADVAAKLDVTSTTALKYLRGQGRPPDGNALQKVIGATRCDGTWLLTGKEPDECPHRRIPVYSTGGGTHWVAAEEAAVYDTEIPDNLVGYRVDGDSMDPIARNGQIALAYERMNPADGDLAYIEMEDGSSMFKRVYIRRNRWLLMSINPQYGPEEIRARGIRRAMRVWGVVF